MKETEKSISESELMDKVFQVVCDVCDVTIEGLLHSKSMPYPNCRGLCWYAMRQITGMTYTRIAQVLHTKGSAFTSQSVCGTTTKTINLISKSNYWGKKWEEIRQLLEIKKADKFEEPIVITIGIPKEAKGKIEFKIVQQKN